MTVAPRDPRNRFIVQQSSSEAHLVSSQLQKNALFSVSYMTTYACQLRNEYKQSVDEHLRLRQRLSKLALPVM